MTFKIITLGCKVNTYESNVMREQFLRSHYCEVHPKEKADIIVINTCSVTNIADQKSKKCIRRALREQPKVLAVVGCMSQHESDSLQSLGEISIILGNYGKNEIVSYVTEYLRTKKAIIDIRDLKECSFETMNLTHFNQTRAFVKIQDGCENFCTYCIIPYTRGPVRSRPKEDIMYEVQELVKEGHKEIVLTGIHTGHYGSDLKDQSLATLIQELCKVEGLERIRISSIEMNEINESLLEMMRKYPILVDHMHIPLQSGCDKILEGMHRKYDIKDFMNKLKEIRDIRPEMSITTDVIVGFPGETEEDFAETIRNVKKMKFSKIHVFPFSKRDGTIAASLEDQIPENIKKERVHRLLEVSKELEIEYMKQFLEKELEFIPEVEKNGYLMGHTGNYLSVKCFGTKEELHKSKKIYLETIDYPYMIGGEHAKV